MKNLKEIVLADAKVSEDTANYLKNVTENGCASGYVTDMIYYTDTIKFFEDNKKEISTMLSNMLEETGLNCPSELFGEAWDKSDPLCQETNNQNLLAWFGYEETARIILEEIEEEV